MEMLIATGIMAVGLVMVATIFPVGVKLTALTTERTIGAVVADEAFAKIQLYGLRNFRTGGVSNWPVTDPNIACSDYQYVTRDAGLDGVWNSGDEIVLENEFLYPSAAVPPDDEYRYHWSALCRRVGDKDVQVTVFVSRRIAASSQYFGYDNTLTLIKTSLWPKPVKIAVDYDPAKPKELVPDIAHAINTGWGNLPPVDNTRVLSFVDDGYTIVDDYSGRIYRILEVKDKSPLVPRPDGVPDTLVLTEDWRWRGYESDPLTPPAAPQTGLIWVVPPAVGSDRYPCVGVYQKVIRFDEIQ